MTQAEGIEKRWSGFGSVPTIIDEKFEDGRGYAQDAFRIANETIQRLSDLAQNLQSLDIDVSTLEDVVPPTIEDFVATIPTSPVIELNMPDELTLVDDIENALHDKLLSDITSGGPAIPAAVEEAIFNRENERALLLHQDNVDKISAEWSRRGFTLPNGILASNLTQAVIEYNNKRLDVSRDIAIKSFELGDTNTKFAIDKALGWYGVKIQIYQSKIQAEIARIDALIKMYMGQVEVYKGTAMVYTTLTDVQIKKFDVEFRMALAKAELIIKDAEIDMENYRSLNGLKIEAMKAISATAAQLIAGALSSVSAGVNMSVSNAASYAYGAPASIGEVIGLDQ